jgi:hypothetical protein
MLIKALLGDGGIMDADMVVREPDSAVACVSSPGLRRPLLKILFYFLRFSEVNALVYVMHINM